MGETKPADKTFRNSSCAEPHVGRSHSSIFNPGTVLPQFHEAMEDWTSKDAGYTSILVEVTYFRARRYSWQHNILTQMRRMVSTGRTAVKQIDVSARISVTAMTMHPPSVTLHIRDVNALKQQTPLLVSAAGVGQATSGWVRRDFTVRGQAGQAVLTMCSVQLSGAMSAMYTLHRTTN